MLDPDRSRAVTRERIVAAAAELLSSSGAAAVTTRGVAEAAGVQAPTIYRLFGDKDGLLEAVAEYVMDTYVSAKSDLVRAADADGVDPLDDLQQGWNAQIDFGLANPTIFRLLSDPERVVRSPAADRGRRILQLRIHRVAAAGRLQVSEERAVDLFQAAGLGTIQTLLAQPVGQRDLGLADAMFQALLGQVLVPASGSVERGSAAPVITLRAFARDLAVLTAAERSLLIEWLDRVDPGGPASPAH